MQICENKYSFFFSKILHSLYKTICMIYKKKIYIYINLYIIYRFLNENLYINSKILFNIIPIND